MRRILAMLLALVLALGLLAVPASAEAVKDEGELVKGEMEVVTVYGGEEPVMGEMETVTVYGEEEPVMGEMETVTVYGEEETGFLGWLKNLWNSILHFFGL